MTAFDVMATTVRNGFTIDAVEFAVDQAPPATAYRLGDVRGKPQPAAIAFHDERGDKATLLPELQILAARGFVCLGIDSPVTRTAMKARDHLEAFESMLAIGQAAARLVQAEAGVLEGSVALLGRSIGGEVAARVAALSDGVQVVAAVGPIIERSRFVATSDHPIAAGVRHFLDDDHAAKVAAGLAPHDLVGQLAWAPTTNWIVQFADEDDRMDETDARTLTMSAARVIRVSNYGTIDDLHTGRARRERLDFISDLC